MLRSPSRAKCALDSHPPRGLEARQAIARRNKTLVKIIHDHPDHPKVAKLAIVTAYRPRTVKTRSSRPNINSASQTSRTSSSLRSRRPLSMSSGDPASRTSSSRAPTQRRPNECCVVPELISLLYLEPSS